jgi:hypothetical protein
MLWMAFMVEENKSADPADVSAFRAQAEMLNSNHSSNLIE